ncbi:hypothetical protein DPMN_026857 [Dreissena polymorpha]|uniref:Uncharacterized protein n=1 Tax=Dreissena polymorpha TaxID=45954 RepID=A0A9D4LU65_DREPO|nr:hypothetical protein DPMN_026857 [Dreissena polymorpha]
MDEYFVLHLLFSEVGRKKKQENVEPKSDGTCAERAGYSCQKCGRKFNRCVLNNALPCLMMW